MANAKLQDVARTAGVSLATASLALSGKGRISAEVRQKVLSTAGELGYKTRNTNGRGSARRICPVGIIHLDDRNHEWNFIRPILLELELAMHREGYAPIVVPVKAIGSTEDALRLIESCEMCAVFSVQYSDEALFQALEERGIFLVIVNNSNFQDRHFSVCVDDFQGAYEGAMYLISLGHRGIAFVEYDRPDMPALIADRFVGFRKALEENRLPFPPEQRVTVPFMDEKRLLKKLGALFGRPERPTAVFAHDDYLGLFVIQALKELGLRVPEDVSLIAPGDVLDYGLPGVPQITTMRINTSLLGATAAAVMLGRFRNDPGHADALHGHEAAANADVHVLKVKEQLVKRASCRSVHGEDD